MLSGIRVGGVTIGNRVFDGNHRLVSGVARDDTDRSSAELLPMGGTPAIGDDILIGVHPHMFAGLPFGGGQVRSALAAGQPATVARVP